MARKPIKPRQVVSEEPREETAELGELPVKRANMSKADAIRAALRAGIESPTAASQYIRNRFGIEVSRTHFSAFKCNERKAENPETPGAVKGYLASPPNLEPIDDRDLLIALEMMKPLVASLGPDKVKRIVDLLG
jgi:hypothetical protein